MKIRSIFLFMYTIVFIVGCAPEDPPKSIFDCKKEIELFGNKATIHDLSCFTGKSIEPFGAYTLAGDAIYVAPNTYQSYFIVRWFAECPPCVKEIPDIVEMKNKHPSTLFVSICKDDVRLDTAFIRKHDFDIHHMLTLNPDKEKIFPQTGFPTDYILNKNLKIGGAF